MQISKVRIHKGFTFIELLIVLAILSILIGFVVINLRGAQNQASISTVVPVIISDIKSQQMKAMTGMTDDSNTTTSHGIYFTSDRYVLFEGDSYQANTASNFTVTLAPNLRFESILFPSSQVVFSQQSGEVSNFSAGNNTITLRNTNDNKTRTITINELGVITSGDE